MSYIYNYLGNIWDYSFKPEEEDKNKYKIIIHKMIDSLFNIIFKGKLDEEFSQDIAKIENKDSSKTKDKKINKKINDILYLTKLSEIIQSILQEETGKQEKKLYNKFREEIKIFKKYMKKIRKFMMISLQQLKLIPKKKNRKE